MPPGYTVKNFYGNFTRNALEVYSQNSLVINISGIVI